MNSVRNRGLSLLTLFNEKERGKAAVLKFVKERGEEGNGPTMEEVADGVGVSVSTVYRYVAELKAGNYLISDPARRRSLQVTGREYHPKEYPVG